MKLGIIGLGNMGSAIIDGLLYKNVLKKKDIFAYSKTIETLIQKCEIRGINSCNNIFELVNSVDVIVISTPANIFEEMILSLKDIVKNRVVISVCSGGNFNFVKENAPSMHFVQTIPSTPIRFGEGIIICENEHSLTKDDLDLFNSIFKDVALIKFLDQKLVDIASTLSGCGPAFIFMLIEALGDAGTKYGLDRENSYELISKMLVGAGTSYLKSKKHPAILKDEVTSPGGTTILGVTKLEECGFRNSLIKAIDAISKREK